MMNRCILFTVLTFFLMSTRVLGERGVKDINANINFNVWNNLSYLPGEDVIINIYTYGVFNYNDVYSDENRNFNKFINFEITVYKITDVEGFFSRQKQYSTIDVSGADSVNLLSVCQETDRFQKKIKTEGYYSSSSFSYRPVSKGAYLMRISHGNRVSYTGFIVSDISMITHIGTGAILTYTVNKISGAPVSDVELNFYLGKRKIGIGKSENGIFYKSIDESDKIFAADNNISQPLITGRKDDDILISDPYYYFGNTSGKFTVFVYTAQPVYRPGNKVNFKAILRKTVSGDFENYPDKEVTVKITTEDGDQVYNKILKTNTNGSLTDEYEIPQNAKLGKYLINVSIENGDQHTGYFYVEEYKKPEYRVGVITDRNQYSNGDVMNITINADYYFGSPLKNADVEYSIFKKEYNRHWWYFSPYRDWYEQYYSGLDENYSYQGSKLLYNGKGKTDSQGKFTTDYTINESFLGENSIYTGIGRSYKYHTDYIYIIQAKVTDKSRRQITSTKSIYVTRSDFTLSAKTDRYLYSLGDKMTLEVMAFNFNDEPVETSFNAELTKFRTEFDVNNNRYIQKEEVITTMSGRTGRDGTGRVYFNIKEEGPLAIKITAKDSKGREITTTTYCYAGNYYNFWDDNKSPGIEIITDKDAYREGEVCKAVITTPNEDPYVLIVYSGDDIYHYKVEKFSGKYGYAEIPLNEMGYSKSFNITVSYVYNGKFYSKDKKVLVIPERKFLTIDIGTDKTTYKPGETATVILRVRDYKGEPVRNAELSLGVVDESIYAIKSDPSQDIKKYYYSDKTGSITTYYGGSKTYRSYSRMITIYERFNLKYISESNFGTVKGRVTDKKGDPVSDASIVIDDDYFACVTGSDGYFEFRLPPGKYKVSLQTNSKSLDYSRKLIVTKGGITDVNFVVKGGEIVSYPEYKQEILVESGIDTAPEVMSFRSGILSHKKKDGDSENLVEPDIRDDFRDIVYWDPSVFTNDKGEVHLNFKFPDNLTEWRITARAVTGDTRIGQDFKNIITRKDLLVRLETPRFFQERDEVTVSAIIHNYLSSAKLTKVSLEAENVEITGNENTHTVVIGSNDEKRIDWKVKVNDASGFAKLIAKALTDEESDAVELKVPIQPYGLQIARFNSFIISDNSASEKKYLDIPQYTNLKSAGVTINIAPSYAATILTALDELAGYPYGCVEQTMSRFLPTVIVAKAFSDFNAPISEATKKSLPKMVEAGYNRLYSLQHSDGGWGWWSNDQTHPFMTAYVLYGLTLANEAGYPVRGDVYNKAISAASKILKSENLDQHSRAYLLYSLSMTSYNDMEFFKKQFDLLAGIRNIDEYTCALLSMAALNKGDSATARYYSSFLISRVKSDGTASAYWGGDSHQYNWQQDKLQITAMALKAVVNDPLTLKDNAELINNAVNWLMQQRTGKVWGNTKTTAIIIYALADYLRHTKELEPDYNVKIYVNEKLIMDKHMTQADVFQNGVKFTVTGTDLKSGLNEVKVEKYGKGKLYISTSLTYYTTDTRIQPLEEGFRVEREYYVLEKYKKYERDEMVYRKRYFSGKLSSGDEILVKIRVQAKDPNNSFFMLEDPIPAGCEVIKNDWAYTIENENDYRGWNYYWWRWWYSDKDIRDNRVVFFATYLYGAVYEFSYVLRAQIPGKYRVNPSIAMLMYYPQYSGSSGDLTIEIEQ